MKRVMVVEDADGIRRALVRLGRFHQWDMVEARDGVEAVELLAGSETAPDLILLDYSMPRMDGLTLLRHLAAKPGGSNVRAVLYTADTNPSVHRQARELGARDVILKASVDWSELVRRLERCMATPAGDGLPTLKQPEDEEEPYRRLPDYFTQPLVA